MVSIAVGNINVSYFSAPSFENGRVGRPIQRTNAMNVGHVSRTAALSSGAK